MAAEKIKVTGILEVLTWKNGKLIDKWVDKNLVVDSGLDAIAKLIGGVTSPYFITKIGFDINGTAPSPSDSMLSTSTLFNKTLTAVSYPATGQVKFDWRLETYEGNSIGIIAEFLLQRSNSELFARRVHPGITKNNTILLTGSWTIQF